MALVLLRPAGKTSILERRYNDWESMGAMGGMGPGVLYWDGINDEQGGLCNVVVSVVRSAGQRASERSLVYLINRG